MVVFQYSAINSQGKKIAGKIDAEHEREVRESLRSQGLMLTRLKKNTHQANRTKLKDEELHAFTVQLAQLLEAGIPLYESLLALEEHTRGEEWHHMILFICNQVKEGKSLSQALLGYPKTFDQLYISMIKAGEATGSLGLVSSRLYSLIAAKIKLRKQLWTALLYPAILALFSLVVVSILLFFVVPSLEALFDGRNVNGLTQAVLGLSRFINQYWWICSIMVSMICLGVLFFLKTPQGKWKVHCISMKTPFVKNILTYAAMARFSRTLCSLLSGGVNMIESLKTSREIMQNPLLEKVLAEAELRIIEGGKLSIELKKSALIPKMIPRMIAIGEESGDIILMFQKIAELYESDVEKNINRIMALAQPVILIFMGIVVGTIMVAVLLPLTDASSFISH